MRSFKKLSYRFISVFTALMLLLTAFPIALYNSVKADEDIGIVVNKFDLLFISGADEKDDGYVWTPIDSNKGHRFLFRLVYSFSGVGNIPAGGIRITLPKRFIKDRNERYADTFSISLPSKREATAMNDFAYEYQDSEVIVSNTHSISAAQNGYFEFTYETTKTTFEYEDMSCTDDCFAGLSISRSGLSLSQQTVSYNARINTYASIRKTEIAKPDQMYTVWQQDWGLKPDDADNYLYIVWTVASYIDATQPYSFKLKSRMPENGTEIVGYKMSGQTTFSNISQVENLRSSGYRWDYVLTRHSKLVYLPLEQYTLTDTVKATVTPKDELDEPTSESAQEEYIYDTPVFIYPPYNWNSWLYGTTSWQEHFHKEWKIADYRLEEFKNGQLEYLDGNLKYCFYTIGMPYPRTLEQNASPDDYSNYGKRKVNYTITDDTFFYCDEITTKEEVITIPPGTTPIGKDDYEIEYLTYRVKINDCVYNDKTMRFVMSTGTFNEDDVLYFDAKFDGSDEWVENVASYNLYNGEYTEDARYVTGISFGKVWFRENCTGYRVRTSNAHYRTQMEVYPYLKLKRSQDILDITGSRDMAWITNYGHFLVTDYDGNVCFAKDITGRDYIAGFSKEVNISKTVTGIKNSNITQSVTINWKAQISEEYISSSGMGYITQDGGCFYDLLPIGLEPVLDTVAIKTNNGYLTQSDFDLFLISNYNDNGRTLMVIKIKEQFDTATLTFSSVYTWESIIDYGRLILNSIAFETGNNAITDGFPDSGGKITESNLMAHLDDSSEGDRFQYAEHSAVVDVVLAASLGLSKSVKSEGETSYSAETTVGRSGGYSYRLRFSSDLDSSSKDIVFYDSLENYSDSERHSSFHGELKSIDVSQMRLRGAAPVVYYSSVDGLDLSEKPDLDEVRDGEKVWKTEAEFGDISKAKAFAIDVRKDSEGNDFVLGPASSVSAIVNMKAPDSDESGVADPAAYNQVYLSDTVIEDDGVIQDFYIFHGFTKVNYRIMADIAILKLDSSDNETPVKGIEFRLEGESDYGTAVDESLTTDRYGQLTFKNIEKGSYTLTETQGSEDYLPLFAPMTVIIDSKGDVYLDGERPQNGSIVVTDEPRVHSNVYFYKRDFTGNGRLINGVVFNLAGKSDYGTDYNEFITSENGRVIFENIEKGSYTLTEVSEAPGYIKSETVYRVEVGDGGEFTITVDMSKGEKDTDSITKSDKGVYSIFNERLHSFSLVKEGYTYKMPIEGAVFELKGTSLRGTEYDLERTTPSNGIITFSDLESGSYVLCETYVPDGYQLDDTPHAVTIDKYGVVTIDGLEKDEYGYFLVPNKENGTITIVKKWIDNDSSGRYQEQNNSGTGSDQNNTGGAKAAPDELDSGDVRSRSGDGADTDGDKVPILPNIVVSTDAPTTCAFFDGGAHRSILLDVANVENITGFKKFSGTDEEAYEKIENGAVRVDDRTTAYKIYAWISEGTVYWWTDARKVFLSDDAHYLFYGLSACSSIDLEGIDTSRLSDMSEMFMNCESLSSIDLSLLDSSRAVNMYHMFAFCKSLPVIDITVLDTSKVTSMDSMFEGCTSLTEITLSGLDTSNVTTTSSMFKDCTEIVSIDLSGLDLRKNTSMMTMFYNCQKVESIDFTGLDLCNVIDFQQTFMDCASITELDLSDLNTVKAETFYRMFQGCVNVQLIDLTNFRTDSAINMKMMFNHCDTLPYLDLSSFDTRNVTTMRTMFQYCYALEEVDISSFDTSNVTEMPWMFNQCHALKSLDLTHFNTSKVKDMYQMFQQCQSLKTLDLTSFDTSNVTSFKSFFYNCISLESVDLSSFDTSRVTEMQNMFYNNYQLQQLDLSNFDTSSVINMTNMFYSCTSLRSLNCSSFDTSNVTTFYSMFASCQSLTELDVTSFNTSRSTDFSWMFDRCSSLQHLDLSSFDVSNGTTFHCMFQLCESLEELDVSGFHTASAEDLQSMFAYCTSVRDFDLSGFVLDNVTTIQWMFRGNGSMQTVYVSELWDASGVPTHGGMFNGCSSLEGQAGFRFNGSTDKTYAHIDSLENPGYLSSRQPSYPEVPETLSNYAYFDSNEDLTSVFSRVCELNEIKHFAHYDGDIENVNALIEADLAYRVDDGTPLNPPIYAWLEEDGTLYWWSQAKNIFLTDATRCLWRGLSACESIDHKGINMSKLTDMSHMFEGCSSLNSIDMTYFDFLAVTNTSYMFCGCSSIEDLYYPYLLIPLTTDMSHMFENCSSAKRIYFRWLSSTVTDFSYMFSGCTALEDSCISSLVTTSATDMKYMFNGCSSMKSFDMPRYDTSLVTDMSGMFAGCSSAESMNIRTFNTSQVTSMKDMFRDCSSMTGFSVTGFDVSNVTDMSGMFAGCTNITALDLSKFETINTVDMSSMFAGCSKLVFIYASGLWNTDSLVSSDEMFLDCSVLRGSHGTDFDANYIDGERACIDTEEKSGYLSEKGSTYSSMTYTTESDNCEVEILDDDTWVFTFTGLDPNIPYYVWEEDYGDYISTNPRDNYIGLENGTVTITNRSPDTDIPEESFGSIKVTKSVNGDELTENDRSRSFLFTLTLTDAEENALEGTSIFGTTVFNNGVGKFRLSDSQSIVFSDIPAGYHYSVTEESADGFSCTAVNGSGTVVADESVSVSFTNTKIYTQQDNTSFRIKKEVTGNYETEGERFSFTVSLSGLRNGELYTLSDGTEFRADSYGSGVVSVSLGNGEEVTVQDIPVGTKYRVSEAAGDYISSFRITDPSEESVIRQSSGFNTQKNKALSTAQETAEAGENALVTFTNKKDVRQNLTLKKSVKNTYEGSYEKFGFTIEITGLGDREQISTDNYGRFRADSAGRLEIDLLLGDGETAVIYDLPVGAVYTVTEAESDYTASYIITDRNGQGRIEKAADSNDEAGQSLSTAAETINEGEDAVIEFTNVKISRDITVTKMVDMTYGSLEPSTYKKHKFIFTGEFTGLEAGHKYIVKYTEENTTGSISSQTVTADENGKAELEFSLCHGQSATIKDLPVDAGYVITEKAVRHYISSFTVTGNDGAQINNAELGNLKTNTALSTAEETVDEEDLDIRITFRNMYSASDFVLPNAGRENSALLMLLIFASFILTGGAFIMINRRKDDNMK